MGMNVDGRAPDGTGDGRAAGTGAGRAAGARDLAAAGLVFAIAACAWFAWGRVGERFAPVLLAGVVVAALVAVGGVLILRSAPGPTRMSTDPRARRTYWIAMVGQIVAILAGMIVLGVLGRPEYAPAWVLAVVGAHFLPLAGAFGTRILSAAGVACVAVAVVAVVSGLVGWMPAPTVAGGIGGLVLLACAVAAFGRARRA